MTELCRTTSDESVEQLRPLACGPDKVVLSWSGYVINGFKFHTKSREARLKTQNSGVVVNGDNGADRLNYYGVLIDVVELQYLGGNRVVLFKCDWRDIHSPGRGIERDRHGFVSVNSQRILQTNEPFVLASQCEQVFYVRDNARSGWLVVTKAVPREFYVVPEHEVEATVDETDALQPLVLGDTSITCAPSDDVDHVVWNRPNLPMETIPLSENNTKKKKRKRK